MSNNAPNNLLPAEYNIITLVVQVATVAMMLSLLRMITGSWLWEFGEPKTAKQKAVTAPSRYEERREQHVSELQARKLELEEKGRSMASDTGVEFTGLDTDWRFNLRYWFSTAEGAKIVAKDLDELKWKLSVIR